MKSSIFLLLLSLTLTQLYGHEGHVCAHHKINFKPKKHDIPIDSPIQDRMLQTYQNIRITFEYSTLTGVSTDFLNYVQNEIIPIAKNYLQAALKVKPVSGKLMTTQTTLCEGIITVPSVYTTAGGGVDADLVIFLTQTNEPTESFVAYAGACSVDVTTNRPLFGRFNFNLAEIQATTSDVKKEQDISTAIHEITHVLGFSDGLYDSFINPATNAVLTGHYFNKTVNGMNVLVLNLPSLTSRIRTYFNCPTADGAYIENEGSSGSAGAHFERRIFYNDYMTASAITDVRITEFSLALLEGTGWYQVDYNLAEPVTYGKKKGCTFLDSTCVDTTNPPYTPRFEEFCSPLTVTGCGWTLRGVAACGSSSTPTTSASLPSQFNYYGNQSIVSDTFADNCPTFQIFSNLDCEDSTLQSAASLGTVETYSYGSKCFLGTLAPGSSSLLETSGFCFKPTCEAQGGGGYVVKLSVGNTSVTCSAQGEVTVAGYGGKLQCPDPTKFCTQIENEGYCRRKCSGRGSCLNKVCQCMDGWTFHDCTKKTYTDNCASCANKDILKTSCYGDTCACNPSNITCMCQLGLTTGTACANVPPVNNGGNTGGNTSDSSVNTGAIIGGVFGGVAVASILIFIGVKYGAALFGAKAAKAGSAGIKASNVAPQNVSQSLNTTQKPMFEPESSHLYPPQEEAIKPNPAHSP